MQKNEVSRVFGAAIGATLGLTALLSGCAVDSQGVEGGVEPEPMAVGSLPDAAAADSDAPIKASPAAARKAIIVQAGETYTLKEDEIFEAPQERAAGEGEKSCLGRTITGWALQWQGDFGDWATCVDQCPVGSLAYSIRLKSEPKQGSGDDTAVNGIALDCWKPINSGTAIQYMGSVTSWQQKWGSWGSGNTCPVNKPIIKAVIRSERALGSGGDDVALTNLTAVCKDGAALVTPSIPSGTNWGVDREDGYWCPAGSAVCGIETHIERDQGSSGDDTALNGVKLSCCSI